MKRCSRNCTLLLLMLCLLLLRAAAVQSTYVEIPVRVVGGGSVQVLSVNGAPQASQSHLDVKNGQTGMLHIDFLKAGTYTYQIMTEPDARDLLYDETVYQLFITVSKDENGALQAVAMLEQSDSEEKCETVEFENKTPEQTNPTTKPDISKTTAPSTPAKPQKKPTSQPKTGDDSFLYLYLLLMVAASAGLFLLALIYTMNTHRLLENKRRNSTEN